MPEPLSLRKVLGPGVIAAGIGLASGEFILWPYITSQVGWCSCGRRSSGW